MEELRLACGEVTDAEMTSSQPNHRQLVDDVNQNLDENGAAVEEIGNNDEDVVSDNELDEVHEFILTQRQRNAGPQVTQSVPAEENLMDNEENKSNSESELEEEDEEDLSQALLRKLEETFSAELREDENQILSDTTEEAGGEICDKLDDSPSSVHTCESDQLMLAALDSNNVEVSNENFSQEAGGEICDKLDDSASSVRTCESDQLMSAALDRNNAEVSDDNVSLAAEVMASDDYPEHIPDMLCELDQSLVVDHVEDDETENQLTSNSVKRDSEIYDTVKYSETDHPLSTSAADGDESLVANHVEDNETENRLTSNSVQHDSEICNTVKDSETTVNLTLASASDCGAVVSDLNDDVSGSVTKTSEDDETENQLTSNSAPQDCKFCDTVKDSETDHLSADSDDVIGDVNDDVNGSVTETSESTDVYEDNNCSIDTVDNKPASPVPATEIQSSTYSIVSSPPLFEDSSLEQLDFDEVDTNKDISAQADDDPHVNESSNLCKSPNDLFNSPTSHKSVTSPAASPQTQLEIPYQQSNQTPPSSPRPAVSPVGSPQMQPEKILSHQSAEAPLISLKSEHSPAESLHPEPEILTKRGNESPPAEAEIEITAVIEARPAGERSDRSENGVVSKSSSLRRVRAKTRNSLFNDSANLSHYSSPSSCRLRSRSRRKSRPVYSDVEPDSSDDDDVRVNRTIGPEKSQMPCQVSSQLSFASSSSSTPSVLKECYVKLTRINDADLLPQVTVVFPLFCLNSFLVEKLKLNHVCLTKTNYADYYYHYSQLTTTPYQRLGFGGSLADIVRSTN